MKCTKTMLATGAVMLAVLAIAYAALPQFRALVVSAAPILLFLLCPLSMLFMMKGMHSHGDHRAPFGNAPKESPPSGESELKR